MYDDDAFDKYERLANQYCPEWMAPAQPAKHAGNGHPPKVRSAAELVQLTDESVDLDTGFQMTYQPSRHEQGWLLDSLRSLYDQGLIVDVLFVVKGGKEATVYCCRAHPSTGLGLVAAKVYRPRMFRNLRNDAAYRVGRDVLTADGKAAGKASCTIARAIRNKTPFGMEAAHTSWLMHEYAALCLLHDAGAAVPRPLAGSENAVLMTYHGDELTAAPTLNTVDLDPIEALRLYHEVWRNVDLMLRQGLVHGDLSAYNILYWEGEITLIDFPQVVNLHGNPRAREILERDVTRVCEYFSGQGLRCQPDALTRELWRRYVPEMSEEEQSADRSRLLAEFEQPA